MSADVVLGVAQRIAMFLQRKAQKALAQKAQAQMALAQKAQAQMALVQNARAQSCLHNCLQSFDSLLPFETNSAEISSVYAHL